MKVRLTQPKNNKYYIRTVTGGLNGAIAGKPTIAGANVLANCVGFANGRFNEVANDPDLKGVYLPFKWQLVCNAENFIESAKKQGLKVNSTPIQGGIMVWQKGKTLSGSDGAGHVAVVEEVYEDGSILTSESGYNAWAFKTVRRYNTNGRWGQASGYTFRGCIINPTVKDPKVVPAPKLVVDGIGGANTVRAMQKFFGTPQDGIISGQNKTLNKYYPSLTAVEYGKGGSACIKKLQKWVGANEDGILGQTTVKLWQKKIGVAQDGIFSANSMKVWQKYLNENDKAVYPTKPTTPTGSSDASKIPSLTIKKTNAQVIADAIIWAKWIAGDNSFHYGYTNKHGSKDPKKWNPNAHHNGCYFCGTNVTSGGRSKKGIVDYQKTYCCNPFVGASWAHGGCVPKALELCRSGSSWDFHEGRGYDTSSLFTNLGKPAKSKLKAGDVLCSDSHVVLYIGNGQIAEAGGGDDNVRNSAKWNNSIKVTDLTDARYKKFKRVHRFNSSVNATMNITHGEVSDRVGQLQDCLGITSDRVFGEKTLNAVKEFQKKNGLVVDGIVGAKTISALSEPVADTWVDRANAWAKKIANDNTYHYKLWKSKDAKTHLCPICNNYPVQAIDKSGSSKEVIKGYHGWNCIGFAYAVWRHGGGIPCKCNCGVISNGVGEKMLKVPDAEALKIAKQHIGINDIKVIKNKNGIPKSQWKAGDICMKFNGNTYTHNFYYMGNGKIADSTGSGGKTAPAKQIAVRDYKNYSAKIIIRYTGK